MQSFEDSLTFELGLEPEVSLKNFWPPENGFIWSRGRWCEIIFSFALDLRQLPRQADLIVDMDAFKHPKELEAQHIFIYLNGLRIGSYYISRRTTYFATFDARILKSAENVLIVDTPDVASPSMFGGSDTRHLGVQLFSLQVRKSG